MDVLQVLVLVQVLVVLNVHIPFKWVFIFNTFKLGALKVAGDIIFWGIIISENLNIIIRLSEQLEQLLAFLFLVSASIRTCNSENRKLSKLNDFVPQQQMC